jgi:hypothetical protein
MAIGNAFNFVKTVLALKLYVRNISFISCTLMENRLLNIYIYDYILG